MIMMDVRRLHDNCDNSTECRGKNSILNGNVGGDNDTQSANPVETMCICNGFLKPFHLFVCLDVISVTALSK